MPDKKQTRSELVAAAEDFDRELGQFGRLTEAAQRSPLDSQKSLQRIAATFTEIGQSDERLVAAAHRLLRAINAAQVKQQGQAEALRVRAQEVRERTERASELLQAYSALGEAAGLLNTVVQELSQAKHDAKGPMGAMGAMGAQGTELNAGLLDVLERLGQLAGSARALMEAAREGGFEDIAREVDGLRQQTLSARAKLSAAYEMKRTDPNGLS